LPPRFEFVSTSAAKHIASLTIERGYASEARTVPKMNKVKEVKKVKRVKE
jgi:hypothetical protein